MSSWKRYKFKNLSLFGLSFLISLFLFRIEIFHTFLLHLGKFGYIGAFIGGMLFVSTFTVTTGAYILLVIAESISPTEIGIIAGFGAVMSDLIMFHIVKDDLASEIKRLYKRFGGDHVSHVLHSQHFRWTLPVIGAVIIASPLPDELGVSLMGLSKMKTYQFILISFLLNAAGIFLVVSASNFIKP